MKPQIYFALVAFTFSLAVTYADDEENWSAEQLSCVEELQLNQTEIYALNKRRISPEDNDDFNNFLSCYWKKKDLQSGDGEISWKNVQELLAKIFIEIFGNDFGNGDITAETIVDAVVEYCKNQKISGDTDGQTVIKVQNCLIRGIKDAMAEVQKSVD